MIIDRQIKPFVVLSQESIRTALSKINANKSRFVICVDTNYRVEGVITDGDFRRWAANQESINLDIPAHQAANQSIEVLSIRSDMLAIKRRLALRETIISEDGKEDTKAIKFIPLVDERGRLVAIARPDNGIVNVGSKALHESSPTFIIAEIGINHNGSLDKARSLIDMAAESGADCAKFQMRHMDDLYRNAGNPEDSSADLGSQYTLDILSRSLLSNEEMGEAFEHCRECGLIPLCTPWDIASIDALEDMDMAAYKVASADLTNHDLLSALLQKHKPLLVSTGMSTEEEIRETVNLLQKYGSSYILMHCNSTYPAPFKDVNLRYLNRLKSISGGLTGYSGHERGYAIPVAAVALGAKVIEKHFTDDQEQEGNDHKVSLLPSEFRDMVTAIRRVEESMGSGLARTITQGERMNRENLAKSIIAAVPIQQGIEITRAMLEVRSPGKGLQPNRIRELIGKAAKHNFEAGDFFYSADLLDDVVKPRTYSFRRPYGIPVRYHDFELLSSRSPLDFVEFHLSYKDMELDLHSFLKTKYEMDVVVHSPDLFAGDHIMNLAESDPVYRQRSVDELQRVIDQSREIKAYFKNSARVPIVASLGGFSRNAPVPISERPGMYEVVLDSLSRLDTAGVEILPQTLPPFPWYLGGQLYCNLFVDPEDTVQFAVQSDLRLCLDVSHSKLSCNHRKTSFKNFVDLVGPHTGHLHIVDAVGVDGEGVQIGDGEIDFSLLAQQVDSLCPDAWFIPEIWQGHKSDGEGFWIALDRLERWF